MKLRIVSSLAVILLLASGCGWFLAKDKADAVKKVAVVQYVINPNALLGVVNAEETKLVVAQKNVDILAKELGNTYQIIPQAELIANAGYKGSAGQQFEHFYTAKDMKMFSPGIRELMGAELTPDVAKKLCADLGVDGVITVYDYWLVKSIALGFKGLAQPQYTVNMYDKDGNRAWGGTVTGESETDFGTPAGILAADLETWAKANGESFVVALSQVKTNIGAK